MMHDPETRGLSNKVVGESIDLCRESGWAPLKIDRQITVAKEAITHCRELDYSPTALAGRIAFLKGLIDNLEHARQMRLKGLSRETTERSLTKKLCGFL